MPPIYPTLSVLSVVAVLVVELGWLRTHIFRDPAYWLSLAICFGFMIPVDGWLTKLSAPIVTYRPEDTSEIRPIWDILLEEYAYAFAMLTLVMIVWDHLGRRGVQPSPWEHGPTEDGHGPTAAANRAAPGRRPMSTIRRSRRDAGGERR